MIFTNLVQASSKIAPPPPPQTRPCQLRVEVTWPGQPYYGSLYPPGHSRHLPTQPDGVYTALYGRFAVGDAADLYRLTVGQFDK